MSDFDRIEEERDLVAGLEYEEWAERIRADGDAYDSDDPKSPGFYERAVEVSDNLDKAEAA